MSNPWDPNSLDLRDLWELVVALPNAEWKMFKEHCHDYMRRQERVGDIEEVIRKLSSARAEDAQNKEDQPTCRQRDSA